MKEKAVNAKEVKEEGDFHEENAPRENSTRFSGAFGSRRGVILALILCTTSCVVEDRVNWTDLLTTGREGFENASLYVRTKQPSPAARSESSKHHENRGDLRVKLNLDAAERHEYSSAATWNHADTEIARIHKVLLVHTWTRRGSTLDTWFSSVIGEPTGTTTTTTATAPAAATPSTVTAAAAATASTATAEATSTPVTDPGQPPPTANPTNKFCAGVRVDSTSAYAVVESSPVESQASSNGVHEAASAAAAATSLLAATALVVMAESVEEVTAYTARCRWRCGGC